MSKIRGFMEYERDEGGYRPVEERVEDWKEIMVDLPPEKTRTQAARCMDCGVPFCNNGCPLGNLIPDWNDLVYYQRWEEAIRQLHSTNNFPEFTGLVCPAPCEAACVLGINAEPVAIKRIEWEIIRRAWEEGWVEAEPPEAKTGFAVAVVGSGPAGLAAAQQLARAGHDVTVYEREQRIGGLLRYGIPDFKLEKWLVDRRLEQMRAEGVTFRPGVEIGKDLSGAVLREKYDAIVLATGSEHPRDLPIEGRELEGIHFAMDFLRQQNDRIAGVEVTAEPIHAEGKHVVVLGGGDTGSDCIGTSHRQGAASVTNLELMPRPPEGRADETPWPHWPHMYRESSSHQEGGERDFAVLTKRFSGEDGKVKALHAVRVEFVEGDDGRKRMQEIPGSEFEIPADLVLLAMGYVHPVHEGLIEELRVDLDDRGNVQASETEYATSLQGVFAAGDCRRGQSLVVWAIWEGRECARAVDAYLRGESVLPSRDAFF